MTAIACSLCPGQFWASHRSSSFLAVWALRVWHTEHHTFASIPCCNLGKFHRATREHWEKPQTLLEAWREMNSASDEFLVMHAGD